jgi:hypothetical protein
MSGWLCTTREHRNPPFERKIIDALFEEFATLRTTFQQDDRRLREDHREHQARNSAAAAEVDDPRIVRDQRC